jgi:hypothetical protein
MTIPEAIFVCVMTFMQPQGHVPYPVIIINSEAHHRQCRGLGSTLACTSGKQGVRPVMAFPDTADYDEALWRYVLAWEMVRVVQISQGRYKTMTGVELTKQAQQIANQSMCGV